VRDLHALIRGIETTALERANNAANNVMREMDQKLLAQDQSIEANKSFIQRNREQAESQAQMWAQNMDDLTRRDNQQLSDLNMLRGELQDQKSELLNKMRQLEGITFQKASNDLGSVPATQLNDLYSIKADMDDLRRQFANQQAVTSSNPLQMVSSPVLSAAAPVQRYSAPLPPQSFHPGASSHGAEHWLGGGPHDAALVLWDEMQQQAQWQEIRTCQDKQSALSSQLAALGMAPGPVAPAQGGGQDIMLNSNLRKAVDDATKSLAALRLQVDELQASSRASPVSPQKCPMERQILGLQKDFSQTMADLEGQKRDVQALDQRVAILETRPPQIIREVGHHVESTVEKQLHAAYLARHPPSTPDGVPQVGKVYVIGGGADTSDVFSTMEIFDVATGMWSEAPPMAEKRMSAGCARAKDCVYIIGGSPGRSDRLKTGECYNILTDTWTSIPDLDMVRSGVSVVAWTDFLFAIGGFNGQAVFETMEKFSIVDQTWAHAARMETRRFAHATAQRRSKIYAIGGGDGQDVLDSVEEYDINRDEWRTLSPMSTKRLGVCAVTLNDEIYVIGGYDGESHLATVEKLGMDGVWKAVGHMQSRRSSSAAAVCAGCIYVCGGYDGEMRINSVERYNPDKDQWDEVGSMNSMRGGPSACA